VFIMLEDTPTPPPVLVEEGLVSEDPPSMSESKSRMREFPKLANNSSSVADVILHT